MFPAIIKADASVETLTFMGAGGDVNAVVNSNVDPGTCYIDMPEWITTKEITYEDGKFSASKSSTIVFSATENTTGEMRIGTITINNRGKEISYNVEQGSASSDVAVESITLDKTKTELQSGYYDVITATVSPENATDKSLTWTSSDPTVVTVDPDGTIHYKKDGTVTITAKSNSNPDVTATCEVTAYHWEDFAPFGTATGTWNLVAKGKTLTSLPIQVAKSLNRVKVSNFNYGNLEVAKDVLIDWNAETNVCTIKQMSTGYATGGKTIYMATSADGTYDPETATFTLPLKYYTTEGNVATSEETFQLNALVSVSDAGYATTYLPFDANVPEDVKLYGAYVDIETSMVKLTDIEDEAIYGYTPVIIKAAQGDYIFSACFTDIIPSNAMNQLAGTLVEATATELGEDADNYVYVLNKVDDNVGFYHLGGEGSKLAANRAYLLVDKALVDNNATKAFTFTFDEATGISNVNAATKTDGKRFSISGQTVGKGYKGIVIINGKKYVE